MCYQYLHVSLRTLALSRCLPLLRSSSVSDGDRRPDQWQAHGHPPGPSGKIQTTLPPEQLQCLCHRIQNAMWPYPAGSSSTMPFSCTWTIVINGGRNQRLAESWHICSSLRAGGEGPVCSSQL